MQVYLSDPMTLMKKLLSLVFLSTLATFATLVIGAASVSAEEMHPQAYGLLKSIYAYDESYPLDARAVGLTN